MDGVEIPRSFTYEGVKAVIENGVSRDLLKAEMAALVHAENPAHESYRLDQAQILQIANLVGKQGLIDRGLL